MRWQIKVTLELGTGVWRLPNLQADITGPTPHPIPTVPAQLAAPWEGNKLLTPSQVQPARISEGTFISSSTVGESNLDGLSRCLGTTVSELIEKNQNHCFFVCGFKGFEADIKYL